MVNNNEKLKKTILKLRITELVTFVMPMCIGLVISSIFAYWVFLGKKIMESLFFGVSKVRVLKAQIKLTKS